MSQDTADVSSSTTLNDGEDLPHVKQDVQTGPVGLAAVPTESISRTSPTHQPEVSKRRKSRSDGQSLQGKESGKGRRKAQSKSNGKNGSSSRIGPSTAINHASLESHQHSNHNHPTETALLTPHGLPPLSTQINNHWIYVFFRFCAERHRMQVKRQNGIPRDQLSEDETMRKTFVGNVFRELDAGSARMKEKIIPVGEQSNEEICFRVFLYCGFYVEITWQALVDGLGEIPSWKNFNLAKYESILYAKSHIRREVLYTSGFQLVPPTIYFGGAKQLPHFAATLRFIKALMEMGMPERLRSCKYAVDASHTLQTAPTLGGFLSLNLLCYLNDSPHMKFYYRNFASCGPGSRKFLQRIFGSSEINSVAMEEAGLKWLYENQWRYWARLGEDPPHASTIGIRPGMRVLDFENALCWAHRYVNDYQTKGYGSVADMGIPEYDPEVCDRVSMPAWCDEERYRDNSSRAALLGDYEEEGFKLPKIEPERVEAVVVEGGDEGEGDGKRGKGKKEVVEMEVYEVEKIVCRKGNRGDKDGLFRVRWKGYPPEDDTWERASSLKQGAKEVLQDWLDWEENVWGTIARITRENPYKPPAGLTTVRGRDNEVKQEKGEDGDRGAELLEARGQGHVDGRPKRKRKSVANGQTSVTHRKGIAAEGTRVTRKRPRIEGEVKQENKGGTVGRRPGDRLVEQEQPAPDARSRSPDGSATGPQMVAEYQEQAAETHLELMGAATTQQSLEPQVLIGTATVSTAFEARTASQLHTVTGTAALALAAVAESDLPEAETAPVMVPVQAIDDDLESIDEDEDESNGIGLLEWVSVSADRAEVEDDLESIDGP